MLSNAKPIMEGLGLGDHPEGNGAPLTRAERIAKVDMLGPAIDARAKEFGVVLYPPHQPMLRMLKKLARRQKPDAEATADLVYEIRAAIEAHTFAGAVAALGDADAALTILRRKTGYLCERRGFAPR